MSGGGTTPASGYSLDDARAVLQRTPAVVHGLLAGLPERLLAANEGPGTWSPLDVLKHVLWAEVDDWIPRARMIRERGPAETFQPFDREEGFRRYGGRSAEWLLSEFDRLRQQNLDTLDAWRRDGLDLTAQGRHPELGAVTLEQLIATWVAHDLGHVVQIARVLAKDAGCHVGPWRAYLSLLR